MSFSSVDHSRARSTSSYNIKALTIVLSPKIYGHSGFSLCVCVCAYFERCMAEQWCWCFAYRVYAHQGLLLALPLFYLIYYKNSSVIRKPPMCTPSDLSLILTLVWNVLRRAAGCPTGFATRSVWLFYLLHLPATDIRKAVPILLAVWGTQTDLWLQTISEDLCQCLPGLDPNPPPHRSGAQVSACVQASLTDVHGCQLIAQSSTTARPSSSRFLEIRLGAKISSSPWKHLGSEL